MNAQNVMQDKELLTDALMSQKLMTSNYDVFANECTNQQLRSEMVRLLDEEHDIQADVFTEMHNRGWYPTPAAEQQKINDAKQKYQSVSM